MDLQQRLREGSMGLARQSKGKATALYPKDSPEAGRARGSVSLDKAALLQLCDQARACLHKNKTLGPRAEEVMKFLGSVMKSECAGAPTLTFATVKKAHLDKLLSDMLDPKNRPSPVPIQFRAETSIAESLQRQLRLRFGETYAEIDQVRRLELAQTGRLKDVVFMGAGEGCKELWQANSSETLSEAEGNLHFEAGHWWLNLACAHRDGIVSSVLETPTKGKYSVAALPLVSGKEDVYRPGNKVRYARQGDMSDMHLSLLSQVGSKIRILRGHLLKSPLAPKAGVRYDGVYIIRQYGQRGLPNTDKYQVILTLERVQGQRHLREVTQIPTPSQIDDWQLYESHEAEMVKQKQGDFAYMEWEMARAIEKTEHEQWRRTVEVKSKIPLDQLWENKPEDVPPGASERKDAAQ